jgi:glycosyltransferase involved in cell wall biosynthesis
MRSGDSSSAATPSPTRPLEIRILQQNVYAGPIGLSALVPVYNEVKTIDEIISRLQAVSVVKQIIVVDDHSKDGTQAIIQRMAEQGIVVAGFHNRNRGKGAALRTGLELATQDHLIFQDGDLEYDPQDLYRMAEAADRHNAAVVYGSRFMKARGQAARSGFILSHYVGNRALTTMFNILYNQRITDMETCYKLFRTDLLRKLGIDNDRFDVDPELTIKSVRAGEKIIEVPISYAGRTHLAGKKIKPKDAISAMQTLLRYRTWRVGMKPRVA